MLKKKGRLLYIKTRIRLFRLWEWSKYHKLGRPLYKIATWRKRKAKRGKCVNTVIKYIEY